MKSKMALATGLALSVFVATAVYAAPGEPPGTGPQTKGGMKAMKAKRDRDAKVQEAKKKAAELKQQAMGAK